MKNINFDWLVDQVVIEINSLNPTLVFDNATLNVECPWRLRGNDRIIIGYSEYREQQKENNFRKLFHEIMISSKIKSVFLNKSIGDLKLEFEKGIILEIFMDSSRYEGWQLSGPNGFLLVALPGGKCSLL